MLLLIGGSSLNTDDVDPQTIRGQTTAKEMLVTCNLERREPFVFMDSQQAHGNDEVETQEGPQTAPQQEKTRRRGR